MNVILKRISLVFAMAFVFTTIWATEIDPYIGLEDVEGAKSMEWIKNQNQTTLKKYGKSKKFKKYYAQAQKILESKDKIAYPEMFGKYIYNFWQDEQNVRGIWRRKLQSDYDHNKGQWEIVLNLDELSKKENKNWVFKYANCLQPEYTRCLLFLSNGGKDAVEVREFDTLAKNFVEKGFTLPEAKVRVAWRDQDSIFVATEFKEAPVTKSGYPSAVKLWKRDQPFASAQLIRKTHLDHMSINAFRVWHGDQSFDVVVEQVDFQKNNFYIINKDTLRTQKLNIPDHMEFAGVYKDYWLFIAGGEFTHKKQKIPLSSVVATQFNKSGQPQNLTTIFTPEFFGHNYAKKAVQNVVVTQGKILIDYLDDLESKLQTVHLEKDKFIYKEVDLAVAQGGLRLIDANSFSDKFYYLLEGFAQPATLYAKDLGVENSTSNKVASLPQFFNAKNVTVERKQVNSKDGTSVPYYIVSSKKIKKNSKNKVLLYGYGGFNVSMRPYYNAVMGKNWLEQGGVYVLAHIRGGGEFGVGWHKSAIRENKQKSYDDFIAIAEALIAEKITEPQKLAIMGGSNGGLLVGAVAMQKPELYGSVVCLVPLLDMKRYNKLLAGASWQAEYGNPDGKDWEFMKKYSPYQNVKKGVKYPKFLFYTSTKDDRVHPGHARKMAALLQNLESKDVYFYENIDGGHSASANLKERAKQWALIYDFLDQTLN